MAYSHGSDAAIHVNGYNLGPFLNSVTPAATADTAEVSTFGDNAKEYIGGLVDATVSAEGFFSGATGESDAILNAALGVSGTLWSVFPQGDTLGNIGYGMSCIHTTYDAPANMTDAVRVSVSAQVSGGRERGKSHHALSAETAAGNSATIDNGASSALGGVSYVHVTAFSGTSITPKIQHSTDDSVWADLITHAAVSAANSKERKTTAALTTTVNRYTRGAWTGTFTTETFSLLFSRAPYTLS